MSHLPAETVDGIIARSTDVTKIAMEAVMTDPHLQEAGMVQQHQHPTEGALTGLGIATRFSRTPGSIRRLAPTLGQDAMADIAAEWSAAPGH